MKQWKMRVFINGRMLCDPETGDAKCVRGGAKLMNAIRDTNLPRGACFDWCTANIAFNIAKNWRGCDTAILERNICITTYCNETFASVSHRAKCGCPTRRDEDCVNALAAGKCVDKFMRNTVGAALWPELYGKRK